MPQSGSKLLTGITDVVALIGCSVSTFFFTIKAHWCRTAPPLTEQELTSQRCLIKLLMTQRKNTKCAHRTGWCGLNSRSFSSSWNSSFWLQIRDDKSYTTAHFPPRSYMTDSAHYSHPFLAVEHNWEQFQTNHLQHTDIIHHVAECNYYRAAYSTIILIIHLLHNYID